MIDFKICQIFIYVEKCHVTVAVLQESGEDTEKVIFNMILDYILYILYI